MGRRGVSCDTRYYYFVTHIMHYFLKSDIVIRLSEPRDVRNYIAASSVAIAMYFPELTAVYWR